MRGLPLPSVMGAIIKSLTLRWRYDGRLFKGVVGTHFSWCIPIEDMVSKITSNAHQNDYADKVNYETMLESVKKNITLSEIEKFKIVTVNKTDFSKLYPSSISKVLNMFKGVEDNI